MALQPWLGAQRVEHRQADGAPSAKPTATATARLICTTGDGRVDDVKFKGGIRVSEDNINNDQTTVEKVAA